MEKYLLYLKNRNLSIKTIKTYEENVKKFLHCNKNINKITISRYIKNYAKNHSPNSTKLMFSSIKSFLRFIKKDDLLNECNDIRLPSIVNINKNIISLDDFNIYKNIERKNFFQKRNFLIFSVLFYTGIRISELKQINIKQLDSLEFIQIIGKGNKWRNIYIPNTLKEIINENKDIINKWESIVNIGNNQIYKIIRSIGYDIFNKGISPHSLRRSYATNLLNKNINIKIISNLLGHSSIETTSRYLLISLDDIKNNLNGIF